MIRRISLSLILLSAFAMADTPPPGTVKAKTWSGDGVTSITSTGPSGALDVNVRNAISVTNSANGNTGSAVPVQATQVGGSDGVNLRALKVSSTGVLAVDGSAVTQPVSGTFFQATQPVSGTFWQAIQPVSGTVTANAGTGTFAVSASSLPLPTGAATDASVVALQVSQGSTTSGQKGDLVLGAVTTAAPTYTTAQTSPISLTTGGSVRTLENNSSSINSNLSSIGSQLSSVTATPASPPPGLAFYSASLVNSSAPSYLDNRAAPLSMTTAGALRVDGSAVTQPVSGTFWQATQPVSGTVTANAGTGTMSTSQVGRSKANAPARNDYTSVNVTTAAYVQLVASTTSAASEIEIFDSSGQTLYLATGGAGVEVNQMIIFPGGNGRVPLSVPISSRVSIKAISATANQGEIDVNFYQ